MCGRWMLAGGLAGLLLACRSDPGAVQSVSDPLVIPSTTSPTSGGAGSLQFTSQGWTTYYSPDLRLTFRFPEREGQTGYEWSEGPEGDGKTVSWWNTLPPATEQEERDLGRGYGYTFAGAYGVDAGHGYGWITDTVLYADSHSGMHLIRGKGEDLQRVPIDPLRRVNWSAGEEGVIFDSRDFWGDNEPNLEGFAATVNLPGDYHPQIKSLTFYFHDVHDDGRTRRRWHTTTIEDVERVVRSVSLDVSADDWDRLYVANESA
jgi:hypothetical protein